MNELALSWFEDELVDEVDVAGVCVLAAALLASGLGEVIVFSPSRQASCLHAESPVGIEDHAVICYIRVPRKIV